LIWGGWEKWWKGERKLRFASKKWEKTQKRGTEKKRKKSGSKKKGRSGRHHESTFSQHTEIKTVGGMKGGKRILTGYIKTGTRFCI